MHPGAWIAWASCAGMVTFMTTNPFYLGVVVAAAWLVYAAQHQPARAGTFKLFLIAGAVTLCLRVGLVFLINPISNLMRHLFGSTFQIEKQSLSVSVVVDQLYQASRLATLLIVFGTFNAVTDPYGVLRLAPRHFYEPALAASLALSITPRTIEAVGQVREAQSLRGIHPRGGKVITAFALPVLETGMEDAVTLAESMDARGHGRGQRTKYRPQSWGSDATRVAAAAAVAMTVYVVAGLNPFHLLPFQAPSLSPITDPLLLPPVSVVFVLAAALLAIPATLRRTPEQVGRSA